MQMEKTPSTRANLSPPIPVLKLVLQWLPIKNVLNLRRVSKEWDEIIGKSPFVESLCFLVTRDDESAKVFRKLSPTLLLKHVHFECLDLEDEFFKHQPVFRHFTLKHCTRLSTIKMRKCSLGLGRFIELLAFCRQLKTLMIRNCPSLYKADLSLVHWGFCFKYMERNLAGVTTLKLAESKISNEALERLTASMQSLKTLHITHIDKGNALPAVTIINLLRRNCDTLEEVTLSGTLIDGMTYDDLTLLDEFPEMNALRRLNLLGGHFETTIHSIFLQNLFECCNELSQLKLSRTRIEQQTLWNLEKDLTDLELVNCLFEPGTFMEVDPRKLKKLRIIQCNDSTLPKSESSIRCLLQCKLPKLESLELNMIRGGTRILRVMEPSNIPKLTRLNLTGFNDIKEEALKKLFKEFVDLQSLSIIDCENLVDEHFCGSSSALYVDPEETLGNLTNLKDLNLSGTKISERTLVECIPRLGMLESLRLEKTNVNRSGLMKLMEQFAARRLPALGYIGLTNSKCHIKKEEKQMLDEAYPRVILACPQY